LSAARAPGGELRTRRRALGLVPAHLAAAMGCAAETLCGAETGLWTPPRPFWQRADGMLGAGGELLRLYDGVIPGPGPAWPVWDEGPEP
jgi:hypothetical protein